MNENLTELVFIVDMSGSMSDMREDTVGGINTVLHDQKEGDGEVLVSTVVFNNESTVIHDRVPIRNVPDMTLRDYRPSGCTALIDAIGQAIHHIGNVHKYARPEDVPAHTIFVITTDGMENASHFYSAEKVRHMVQHEKDKYGWEFIFLAANIDAAETAERYGIDRSRAVDYHNDMVGTAVKYRASSMAVRAMRCGGNLDCAEWREEADMDFKRRK